MNSEGPFMRETLYIVDNNALAKLGRRRRKTDFFRNHSMIPEDVWREAQGYIEQDLSDRVCRVNPAILYHLKSIMDDVSVGDTTLVDLYQNKGTADPTIVATALAGRDKWTDALWPVRHIIVSNDKAVVSLAKRHDLETLNSGEFNRLIDSEG